MILLLTLITLDFGRIYLGYINLQNMARIAANFAANNPDAWGATPDPATQTKYKNQILADATRHQLPTSRRSAGVTQVPTPTFTDTNGNGLNDLGEEVQVQITCTFDVITPVISTIVGGVVTVSAGVHVPGQDGDDATSPDGGGMVAARHRTRLSLPTVSSPARWSL